MTLTRKRNNTGGVGRPPITGGGYMFNLENLIIHLIKYKPFYGNFILNMNVIYQSDGLHIAGVNVTDKINLFINPKYFEMMTKEEQVAILEHEVGHIINCHIIRKGNRDHQTFNKACDIAINQFIQGLPDKERCKVLIGAVNKDMTPEYLDKNVTGSLYPSTYKFPENLTSEEYYELLKEKQSKEKKGKGDGELSADDHGKWEESEDSHGAEKLSEEYIEEKIKNLVKRVVDQVGCGNVPTHIQHMLDVLFTTKTDWRKGLHRFITRATLISQRYSRKRMNRRFGIVFPGQRTDFKLKVGVAFDQSGSMSDDQVSMCIAELNRINTVSPEIHMYCFDVEAEYLGKYRKGMKVPRKKCGGTDFKDVIAQAQKKPVDALIILTDGQADLNITKPKIPVLWGLDPENYKDFEPPFGNKIELVIKEKKE